MQLKQKVHIKSTTLKVRLQSSLFLCLTVCQSEKTLQTEDNGKFMVEF